MVSWPWCFWLFTSLLFGFVIVSENRVSQISRRIIISFMKMDDSRYGARLPFSAKPRQKNGFCTNTLLVGGFNPPLKNISKWEGLSHILWKMNNVWNHQPVYGWPRMTYDLWIFMIHGDKNGDVFCDMWWFAGNSWWCMVTWSDLSDSLRVNHFGGSRIWSHRHIGRCGPGDWAYRKDTREVDQQETGVSSPKK